MRNFLKLCSLTTVVVILLCLCVTPTGAAQYPDTLRVGINYGSDVVQSINFSSSGGLTIGASSGKSFFPFTTVSDTSATVSKNTAETFHVLYSSHNGADEMNAQIAALTELGMVVFPAFYNSSYCVFGGYSNNYNDALWEAQNLAVQGTPVSVSANTLYARNPQTGKILFVLDMPSYGLAVYSSNYRNSDALLSISGSAAGTYRGGFECKALSGNGLTVVNIVPVEAYLYSVVCREMSPSWHVEALKAQAVCARNFALSRINHHSQFGFDVCRTVCCQVYSTTADQSQNVHTAVDQTRGQLLFHENSLVQAVYSSSMGSTTENAENVWGTHYPYLVGVDNSYEDTQNINNGIWTNTLTKDRATEIMRQKGYNIGNVTDIAVLEYTPNGRVLKLLVKGTHGEKIFERETCRTIFKEATLSQKFTVSSGGTKTAPIVSILSQNGTDSASLSSAAVLTGNNFASIINDFFVATDGVVSTTYQSTVSGGDPNTFVFSGEGWGHGVGMSQFGAKGMAEAGIGYADILTHYYTGTRLVQAY